VDARSSVGATSQSVFATAERAQRVRMMQASEDLFHFWVNHCA
jgi:hypothetical protein